MSRRSLLRLVSVFMVLMLIMSTALATAFALTAGENDIKSDEGRSQDEKVKTKNYKEETVYVLAKANGDVDKIIVSDWIQNVEKKDTIEDVSALENIKNVKGDETYTLNKDNMRVWKADGKDLYLQGESKEDLPVEVRLSYRLDGNVISPEDLAGKSGRVDITFDYDNNQYENVKIDGKTVKMYVPYLMLSGVILDNEKFTDVTVTDGKIINLGEKTIVAGIALPGIKEDLDLDRDEFDIPESVTISANVEEFALETTVTLAANDIFSNIDTKELDSLKDLKSQLSKLEDGMDQLVDGSSQLYSGIATLLSKTGELSDGVKELDDGAKELSDGAKKLSDGSVQIDAGMLDLSGGISNLTSYNSSLTQGSDKVFTTLLKEATDRLNEAGIKCPSLTRDNYNKVLDEIISSLDENTIREQAEQTAREKIRSEINSRKEEITEGVSAAIRENISAQVNEQVMSSVRAQVLSSQGLSEETYSAGVLDGSISEEISQAIESAVKSTFESDDVQSQVESLISSNMSSDDIKALIITKTDEKAEALIEENLNSDTVKAQIEEGVNAAKSGREQVIELKKTLNEYAQFDSGINNYTNGVSSANSGAGTLKKYTAELSKGANDLSDGSRQLYEGTSKLKNAMPSLTSGISKLYEGSMQLSKGLSQFSEEGISKITSLANGDLSDMVSRIKAMVDVSKRYNTYSGLAGDMDGEVKFIYKTEAIE